MLRFSNAVVPSNIHDSAYPVGGIMLSGGTPVVVGPDGPSLGGFVVPAVVIRADRWRLAQCRPGDRLRLLPVTPEQADDTNAGRRLLLGGTGHAAEHAAPGPAALEAIGAPRGWAVVSGAGPAQDRQASSARGGSDRLVPLLDPPAGDHGPRLAARWAGFGRLLDLDATVRAIVSAGRDLAAADLSAGYRLLRLPGTGVPRPGLVPAGDGPAQGIALEVWQLPRYAAGARLGSVPAPLALGRVRLDDGGTVTGFVSTVADGEDISRYGGWRGYLAASGPAQSG
jgi:hypothetical protein